MYVGRALRIFTEVLVVLTSNSLFIFHVNALRVAVYSALCFSSLILDGLSLVTAANVSRGYFRSRSRTATPPLSLSYISLRTNHSVPIHDITITRYHITQIMEIDEDEEDVLGAVGSGVVGKDGAEGKAVVVDLAGDHGDEQAGGGWGAAGGAAAGALSDDQLLSAVE